MAFGLYSLLEAALLVLNAMCVLHEERFLAKVSKSVVTKAGGMESHHTAACSASVQQMGCSPVISCSLISASERQRAGEISENESTTVM